MRWMHELAQEQKSVSARGPFNLWVLLGVSRDLTLLFRAERQAAAATACAFRHTCNFIASRASRRPCRCCICVLAEAGCFGESFRGRHLGFVWKEGCSSSSTNSCSSNTYCTWALAFPFNISLSRLHHINFISFSRWDKTRRVGLTLIPSYLLVICCSPTPYCSGLQGTGPSVGPCVGLVVWFPLFPIRFRVGERSRQDLKGLGGHEHR